MTGIRQDQDHQRKKCGGNVLVTVSEPPDLCRACPRRAVSLSLCRLLSLPAFRFSSKHVARLREAVCRLLCCRSVSFAVRILGSSTPETAVIMIEISRGSKSPRR